MSESPDPIETVEREVLEFLSRYFDTTRISATDDIFAQGIVNSIFAMELILFVEKQFAIRVDDEDLGLDNFRSARAMAQLVGRKRAPSEAS